MSFVEDYHNDNDASSSVAAKDFRGTDCADILIGTVSFRTGFMNEGIFFGEMAQYFKSFFRNGFREEDISQHLALVWYRIIKTPLIGPWFYF